MDTVRINRMNRIRTELQRRMYAALDDRKLFNYSDLVRWNALTRILYPGMKEFTVGCMVNDWLETRSFESRM